MGTGIKVLLVDDEKELLQSLTRVLGVRGFSVETVDSGEAALKRLNEAAPDIIVLDLNMPGMDGLTTLREIRKVDANVPVIVLSGHMNIALGRDVMRLGAAEFLQKPCAIEDLASAIETAFERKTIHTEIRYNIKKPKPRE